MPPVPRRSPSQDSISRSLRGGSGGVGGPEGRAVRCVAAAALLIALRTAFLAIDRRVVCGSCDGESAGDAGAAGDGGALGSGVVPAVDGSSARDGGLVLPPSPGWGAPPGAG